MNNNEFTKNAIEAAILLGAFGEMLLEGIIGLFVGAIVLALGYELFIKWLDDGEAAVDQS